MCNRSHLSMKTKFRVYTDKELQTLTKAELEHLLKLTEGPHYRVRILSVIDRLTQEGIESFDREASHVGSVAREQK